MKSESGNISHGHSLDDHISMLLCAFTTKYVTQITRDIRHRIMFATTVYTY